MHSNIFNISHKANVKYKILNQKKETIGQLTKIFILAPYMV